MSWRRETGRRCRWMGGAGAMLLALAVGVGCGDPSRKTGRAAAADDEGAVLLEPSGAVLLEVDGEPITASQLEAALRRAPPGTSEAEALRELIELTLVTARAREAGLESRPAVRLAQERAMVQRLLALEVEAKVEVDEAKVRKAYDDFAMEFFVPELVTVSHVLIHLPESVQGDSALVAEAMALGEELSQVLRAAVAAHGGQAPPREVLDALVAPANMRGPFAVHAEHELTFPERAVPPLAGRPPRYPTPVRPFGEAAFALSEQHRVSGPVLTPFGVHVVVFLRKSEAQRPPYESVRDVIRDDLLRRARGQAAAALVEGLRARARIEVDDGAVRELAERAE